MHKLRGMFQMLEESQKIDKTNVASPPRMDFLFEMLDEKKKSELFDDVISPPLQLEDFELDGLLSDDAYVSIAVIDILLVEFVNQDQLMAKFGGRS